MLVRGNGESTYFASDCAYYLDKRERGFDRSCIMLGADHHGYVGRLRAMVGCFGDDPDETLEISIGQLVNVVKDGEPVRMSKRAGTFVTLADLVEPVGRRRRAVLRSPGPRSTGARPRHRPLGAADQRQPGLLRPVRPCAPRLAAAQRRRTRPRARAGSGRQPARPRPRGGLARRARRVPARRRGCCRLRAPHRVARYLEELAGTYHRFYDACRVLPQGDEERHRLNRRPAVARRGHPHRPRQRPRPARRQRPGADVSGL